MSSRSRRSHRSYGKITGLETRRPPDYESSAKMLSNIHPLQLEESIRGGRGMYASISILEPVMRIKWSGTNQRCGGPNAKEVCRFVLDFKMQLSINRTSEELERHNCIFDSIDVRYLYRSGERHKLLLKGDFVTTDIQMTPLHLWTPEIYENINSPLTVTREVDAAVIDGIMRRRRSYGMRELRRYLHFDFYVEVRLREIGWGFWGMFKSSSQPQEIRAKNDSGKPLALDRMRFCVECCVKRIRWPQF
ncbi:hypothetical protein B0H67DRAFT_641442 [Lasiosphaeris hirsuta]|uniref:Uncharacterized protein n=1 Tax=Lasiosphaeris hirsuta TaxID=260670 RepID=A0AA40AZP8_9PEZI|nr:hypothetical protein B0H67DRAFT_641442 [Lasiosphaeris hirsuta]